MSKYKINIIFSEENNIDDILIKTLKQELQKFMINNCTYLSCERQLK